MSIKHSCKLLRLYLMCVRVCVCVWVGGRLVVVVVVVGGGCRWVKVVEVVKG